MAFLMTRWISGETPLSCVSSPFVYPGNDVASRVLPCRIVLLAILVLGHGFTLVDPKHVHNRIFLNVTSWLFSILGRSIRRKRGNIPMKTFLMQGGSGGGTSGRKCSCIAAVVVVSDTVMSVSVRIRYWTRSGTEVEAGGNSSRNSKKNTMSENMSVMLSEIFSSSAGR